MKQKRNAEFRAEKEQKQKLAQLQREQEKGVAVSDELLKLEKDEPQTVYA